MGSPLSFVEDFMGVGFNYDAATDLQKQIIDIAFDLSVTWNTPLPGETDDREYMYQTPGKGIDVEFWQNKLPQLLTEMNIADVDWFFISASALNEPACMPTSLVHDMNDNYVEYEEYRERMFDHGMQILRRIVINPGTTSLRKISSIFTPSVMLQMYPTTLDSGATVFVNLWWKVYAIFFDNSHQHHIVHEGRSIDLVDFVNKIIDHMVSRTIVNNAQIPIIVQSAISAVSRNVTDFIYMSQALFYVMSVVPGMNVYSYPGIGYILGPKIVIRTSDTNIHVFTLLNVDYVVTSPLTPELEDLMQGSQRYEITASMMETASEMVRFLI